MDKNYNYGFENRIATFSKNLSASGIEISRCKKSDLKKYPVVNGRVYQTTDTNEFYYGLEGELKPLNIFGSDVSMSAEIEKIKADVAKLNGLESKVNTAVTNANNATKSAQNAATKANDAATKAQAAADAVADKASTEYVDNKFNDIKAITGVTSTSDGSTITLSDGSTIDIKNGTDGKDGKDGESGATGAAGKDGSDGITPEFKIEDGKWYISYDNKTTWEEVGPATGADGKDGSDGASGKDGVDGKDGSDGEDGISISSVAAADITGGKEITVTLSNGNTTVFDIMNGIDGADGSDGEDGTPGKDGSSVSVKSSEKKDGVTTVVLTDGTNETILTIEDGADGTGTGITDSDYGTFPEVKTGNEVSSDDGIATVKDVVTYVKAMIEKKNVADCIYVNGSISDIGETSYTPIDQINRFVLNDYKDSTSGNYVVMVRCANEAAWGDAEYTTFGNLLFNFSIPVAYSVDNVQYYDEGATSWGTSTFDASTDTIMYGNTEYVKYTRHQSDSSNIEGTRLYKITIKKD